MVDTGLSIPSEIQQAIDEIAAFSAVQQVIDVDINDNYFQIKTEWAVQLPNVAQHQGVSRTGIRDTEPVYWRLPGDYPLRAPSPWLRVDFPNNLPHINHYTPGEMISPCISVMPLNDLLHTSGLAAILTAMMQWLNNAAADELHCPVQGWEYVRRNNTQGMVMVDTHAIRHDLATKNRTVRFYRYQYLYVKEINGTILGNMVMPSLGSANESYKRKFAYVDNTTASRNAPCILFQTSPDKVIDEYRAEAVSDFQSLCSFAGYLGLNESFQARIKYLLSITSPEAMQKDNKVEIEEFLVAFAIKRPFNLIGLDSDWELLPYRVSYAPNSNLLPGDTRVAPVQFVERISSQLLQSVSGQKTNKPIRIGALGCGSLGSKIVLHMAKSGKYEFDLVDKDIFSSHNNARHGLVVSNFDALAYSKSHLLSRELAKLNIASNPIDKDICTLGQQNGYKLKKNTAYIIDSTASLQVRHFFAHRCKHLPGHLIHTVMYGKATMGVVALEGVNRTVRVDDLMAYTNALCIEIEAIQVAMYGNDGPGHHHYGEGCGSVTTTMNDIDISLMTAAITSKINSQISSEKNNLPGLLHIGTINKESLNMRWERHVLPTTLVIRRDNSFAWEIRVLGNIADGIKVLCLVDTSVENGGVIAGQVCTLSRTIYVTTMLDAPDGSLQSENAFDLSTAGLAHEFESIHQKTNGQITFLGTWHSHTRSFPPSAKDKKSLGCLQSHYDLPIVMLTYTGGRIVRV